MVNRATNHESSKDRSRSLDIFNVIGDPTKRRILELTHEREWCVNQMVDELRVSQPAVSKHLRALRDSGLVDVRIDGQRRWYRLRADQLSPLTKWVTAFVPEQENAEQTIASHHHNPYAGIVSGQPEVIEDHE